VQYGAPPKAILPIYENELSPTTSKRKKIMSDTALTPQQPIRSAQRALPGTDAFAANKSSCNTRASADNR